MIWYNFKKPLRLPLVIGKCISVVGVGRKYVHVHAYDNLQLMYKFFSTTQPFPALTVLWVTVWKEN
jgi:hypothetical protein